MIVKKAKYDIGDRVKVKGNGKTKSGEIVDIFKSKKRGGLLYFVKLDGNDVRIFREDEFVEDVDAGGAYITIEQDDGRVFAILHDEDGNEIRSAFGNIYNPGVLGYVQAASIAMKHLYFGMQQEE